MRAGWAKRILFLCDRRELRKQADRDLQGIPAR
jgi:type I restriction enzyme R subunit